MQYAGWDANKAVAHYLERMKAKIPVFETMERTVEKSLNFIKVRQTPLVTSLYIFLAFNP